MLIAMCWECRSHYCCDVFAYVVSYVTVVDIDLVVLFGVDFVVIGVDELCCCINIMCCCYNVV